MENCLCSGSGFGDGTGPERGGGWGRRPASSWLIIGDVGRICGSGDGSNLTWGLGRDLGVEGKRAKSSGVGVGAVLRGDFGGTRACLGFLN